MDLEPFRICLDIERFDQEKRCRRWKSDAQAARALGISASILSKMRAGKHGAAASTIHQMVTGLGVPYEDLFYREDLR